MSEVRLEHANVTVSDLERTAKMLGDVFGWAVRWEGASKTQGHSLHVGARTVTSLCTKSPLRRHRQKTAMLRWVG